MSLKLIRVPAWPVVPVAVVMGLALRIDICRAAPLAPQAAAQSSAATSRLMGTVKSVSGNTIVLTTQAGSEASVSVAESTRLVRAEPGQKSLTPAHIEDVQPGDRILVRGTPSADGRSVAALSVIVMKQTDIAHEREREQQEWTHGIGGLVSAVDPAAETVTVSTMSLGAVKKVTVHATKVTVLRRYAPNSVKYSDSKPAPFSEIKPGDQLRARGTRSADGSDFTADEIVSGSFQNIAGTIASVDTSTGEVTVMNLLPKGPVTVAVTAETELRKLPPMMAQGLAMRLKGGRGGPPGEAEGTQSSPHGAGEQTASGGFANRGPGGAPDLQETLNRLPPVKLGDLKKGEVVMIVATEGSSATAIKLLSGVEPLLAASPKGGESAILSAWSLSAPSGGEGEAQ